MLFSASLSGSDDLILYDSDGDGAYSHTVFYAIFQFFA